MAIATTVRRSSFHAKTVELPLSELPPPPNPMERMRDALERAMFWAPELGADVVDAVAELLTRVRDGRKAA